MTEGVSTQGLVSVIIPTYKRPEQVRLAVASVLAQTWTRCEAIVVSDGPDEATLAALREFADRVTYIELPTNQGPAAARNAGVAASRGEWLSFLDDDDTVLPAKLERQMALADSRKPLRMIACRSVYAQKDRQAVWPSVPLQDGEDLGDYLLRRPSLLGRPGVIPIQSLLIHRSLVMKLPFISEADHEDWSWLLQAWHQHGARVVFVWEALVVYNIDANEMSRSRRNNWRDSLAWAEKHRAWISDRSFCSFLATKVALKARCGNDSQSLRTVSRVVLRNRPGSLELIFLLGVWALPARVLRGAWKRSLANNAGLEGEVTDARVKPA